MFGGFGQPLRGPFTGKPQQQQQNDIVNKNPTTTTGSSHHTSLLPLRSILYTATTIRNQLCGSFAHLSVTELADALKEDPTSLTDVKPMKVVTTPDGRHWSLNNRRLCALHKAFGRQSEKLVSVELFKWENCDRDVWWALCKRFLDPLLSSQQRSSEAVTLLPASWAKMGASAELSDDDDGAATTIAAPQTTNAKPKSTTINDPARHKPTDAARGNERAARSHSVQSRNSNRGRHRSASAAAQRRRSISRTRYNYSDPDKKGRPNHIDRTGGYQTYANKYQFSKQYEDDSDDEDDDEDEGDDDSSIALEETTLHINQLRFSQGWVRNVVRHGCAQSIVDMAEQFEDDPRSMLHMDPLRVYRDHLGRYWCLDNRRLAAIKHAFGNYSARKVACVVGEAYNAPDWKAEVEGKQQTTGCDGDAKGIRILF